MSARWPSLMRRKTAAEYLDMSEDTFTRQVASGALPAGVLWGRTPYWRRDALDAAIAGGETVPDWEAKLYDKINGQARYA